MAQVDTRFGQLMRELRRERGVSLRALAQVTHYGHTYLWDIETGRKSPSRGVAEAVDAALQASGRLLALAMGPAIAPTNVPQPYGVLNPSPADEIDPGEWLQARSESLTNASQWAQLASWLYDRFVRERPRLMRLSTTRYSRASRETHHPWPAGNRSAQAASTGGSPSWGTTWPGAHEQVFVRPPSGDESAGLRMTAGSPVIDIVHTGYDAAGLPFEVTHFVMRADQMGVVYEFTPVE